MTIDPNELADRWRALAGTRGDMGSGARRTCADELSGALAWHPMTDEPKGVEGALLAIDSPDSDLVFAYWDTESGGWEHELMVYNGLPWVEIRERFPDATWCYLPRRKNDG